MLPTTNSLYIRAAEHEDKADDSNGSAEYRKVMETLIDRYPDDLDAQAFLALEEMDGYKTNGHPRDGEIYSQALLRNLLAAHPENAAANHYWIHAMEDSSRPEEALRSADILGPPGAQLRPHGPHAGPYLLASGRLRAGAAILHRLGARR